MPGSSWAAASGMAVSGSRSSSRMSPSCPVLSIPASILSISSRRLFMFLCISIPPLFLISLQVYFFPWLERSKPAIFVDHHQGLILNMDLHIQFSIPVHVLKGERDRG